MPSPETAPALLIESRIWLIRGQKVLLDSDLAELYGVPTKAFNQAVKRNLHRFPEDFMFRLTLEEGRHLESLRSQTVTLKRGRERTKAEFAKLLRVLGSGCRASSRLKVPYRSSKPSRRDVRRMIITWTAD